MTDTLDLMLRTGDTVILAKENAHRVARVREAIEAIGHGFSNFRPKVSIYLPLSGLSKS